MSTVLSWANPSGDGALGQPKVESRDGDGDAQSSRSPGVSTKLTQTTMWSVTCAGVHLISQTPTPALTAPAATPANDEHRLLERRAYARGRASDNAEMPYLAPVCVILTGGHGDQTMASPPNRPSSDYLGGLASPFMRVSKQFC